MKRSRCCDADVGFYYFVTQSVFFIGMWPRSSLHLYTPCIFFICRKKNNLLCDLFIIK